MKPGTITHTVAVILSSIASLFTQSGTAKAAPSKVKISKKSDKLSEGFMVSLDSLAFAPRHLNHHGNSQPDERFPWKKDIVTTVHLDCAKSIDDHAEKRSAKFPRLYATKGLITQATPRKMILS